MREINHLRLMLAASRPTPRTSWLHPLSGTKRHTPCRAKILVWPGATWFDLVRPRAVPKDRISRSDAGNQPLVSKTRATITRLESIASSMPKLLPLAPHSAFRTPNSAFRRSGTKRHPACGTAQTPSDKSTRRHSNASRQRPGMRQSSAAFPAPLAARKLRRKKFIRSQAVPSGPKRSQAVPGGPKRSDLHSNT